MWFPKDYMYKSDEKDLSGLTVFCTSINKENIKGNSFSTFGSLFMRHYDIYFNRKQSTVSFVRAECDDLSGRSYPVLGIRKTNS